jgi:PIN domain nuclease of toxin-antitoxin system
MRVLVDTQAFLWWIAGEAALSSKARRTIADPDNECLLSLASCWEMAIKVSLGKLKLPGVMERFIPEQLAVNAFRQLEIEFRHVARVASLPLHHRDPFDRLLVAQALEERCPIVSADPLFKRYGVERIW